MAASVRLMVGMTCPSCGGAIEVREGSRLAHCSFCDAALAITADDAGVAKLMYPRRVSEDEALAAAKRWFGVFPKARDLAATAEVTEQFSMYIPFWRLSGTGKAIVCGTSTSKDKDGHATTTPHEEIAEGEYVWSTIACQTGDLGITTPPQPDSGLQPYVEGDVPVFETTSSRDEAFDAADSDIRMEVYRKASAGIDTMTFTKTFCIPREFCLLYYPYWIIRYQYRARDYFVVLDGVSGVPVSGRAPGDTAYQAIAAGLGAGFGGLVTGICIAFAAFSGSEYALWGLAGIVAGLVLVLAGYWVFRFGSDVVEGKLTGGISFSTKGFGQKTVQEVV